MKKMIAWGCILVILVSACGNNERSTREGYKIYSNYGFSFEFPEAFLIVEEDSEGVEDLSANNTSGMVGTNSVQGNIFATVSWFEDLEFAIAGLTPKAEDLKLFLDYWNEEGTAETGANILKIDAIEETTRLGHLMLYQYGIYENEEEEEESIPVGIIMGVLYCDTDQKFYSFVSGKNETGLQKDEKLKGWVYGFFHNFVEHFICHEI